MPALVGRRLLELILRDAQGRERLRGIFSATQIARQLGIPVTTDAVARTFADIEQLLTR